MGFWRFFGIPVFNFLVIFAINKFIFLIAQKDLTHPCFMPHITPIFFMKALNGISVASGFASGRAFIFKRSSMEGVPAYVVEEENLGKEIKRLDFALRHAVDELETMRECLMKEVGVQEAAIFDAHILFVSDPKFQKRIRQRIHTEKMNCEQAIKREIDEFIRRLSALKNAYTRERIMDIHDIGIRLLRNLRNQLPHHPLNSLPENTVIVAEELLPSDSINMDREHVVGIATEFGGSTSHAAILARAMGIPCVVGLPNLTQWVDDGSLVLVDGGAARVTIAPSEWQKNQFRKKQKIYEETLNYLTLKETQECRLKDGPPIDLRANINSLEDIHMVKLHNLKGAGLFRTELVFMGGDKMPGLAKQKDVYLTAARQVAPHPLVIRTFDYSADKHPDFLDKKHLVSGLRGVAWALTEKRLFSTQLHAILRAFKESPNIQILLPMVASKQEILGVKEILAELCEKEDLKMPPIGAMIETPIAVFSMEDFVSETSFSSIGSNDLAQYMLGIERQLNTVSLREWILEPALLRTFEMVFKCAAKNNGPVSVCGLAASDPVLASILVGLGARELSLDPVYSPQVRYSLCHISLSDCTKLAARALAGEPRLSIIDKFNGLLPHAPFTVQL